ncbi:matrixin family metalloprotease [Longitalea arenae]|uniref:matrixin family metalloprotease n=1 Tax=Longitalea arenae TaxID=2812558 RepID=UPI0019680BD3|nr:matrixin family metalloprotease [Longitalea arenae]
MPNTLVRQFTILFAATLLSYCSSPIKPGSKQIIGLQPLGKYDTTQLSYIEKELQQFFKVPVVILHETALPAAFLNTTKGERYSGDSIIKWLAFNAPDSITKVVGLTHKDIFTTKKENGQIKKPESTYAVWGIFGLGYRPGRSCVISDFRLKTSEHTKFQHRLRTVVIHELGHNQGLDHCPAKNCIMSDANERIQTVDNSGVNYCGKCLHWLKH